MDNIFVRDKRLWKSQRRVGRVKIAKHKPTLPNGIARLKVENLWLSLQMKKKLSIQIFRLSGIYSNQNNILVRLKLGTAKID